jgi:cysteinyl-tRNA synthetase
VQPSPLRPTTMAEEAQATPPTAVAEEVQEAPLPATTVGAKAPPQLELFNSMTKRKEPFQPLVEGKVAMYVCGVTPYDFSHIGHARAYVAFDVLYR